MIFVAYAFTLLRFDITSASGLFELVLQLNFITLHKLSRC